MPTQLGIFSLGLLLGAFILSIGIAIGYGITVCALQRQTRGFKPY